MPDRIVLMTPSSGMEITPDGRFGIGVELMNLPVSPDPSSANLAVKSCPIPPGFTGIVFVNGSARIQEDPKRLGRAVALFRVHLSANPDDRSGWAPINLAVGSIGQDGQVPIQTGVIPLRLEDQYLVVELQEAAGVSGINVELQISGYLV